MWKQRYKSAVSVTCGIKLLKNMVAILTIGGPSELCVILSMLFFFLIILSMVYLYFQTGAKHLQKLSGIGSINYWLPTFVFDAVVVMLTSLISILIIYNQELDGTVKDGNVLLLIMVYILFTWAVLPYMYLLHYAFKNMAKALMILQGLSFITGKNI